MQPKCKHHYVEAMKIATKQIPTSTEWHTHTNWLESRKAFFFASLRVSSLSMSQHAPPPLSKKKEKTKPERGGFDIFYNFFPSLSLCACVCENEPNHEAMRVDYYFLFCFYFGRFFLFSRHQRVQRQCSIGAQHFICILVQRVKIKGNRRFNSSQMVWRVGKQWTMRAAPARASQQTEESFFQLLFFFFSLPHSFIFRVAYWANAEPLVRFKKLSLLQIKLRANLNANRVSSEIKNK